MLVRRSATRILAPLALNRFRAASPRILLDRHLRMIWFLCAFALALFVAGLLNSDGREGWAAMIGALVIIAGLLLVFGTNVLRGLP